MSQAEVDLMAFLQDVRREIRINPLFKKATRQKLELKSCQLTPPESVSECITLGAIAAILSIENKKGKI